VEQIIKLLREESNFIIASHIGPDGDAIGSAYGLAMALNKLGKKVTVMLEQYPTKYNIVPGREFLYNFKEPLENDVFIALDCADTERLGFTQPFFRKAKITVCIDHHATNPGFADHNLLDPSASSTSEMVLAIIESLTEIDKEIATAIYTGIVTDTGGFKYSNTSRSTLEAAARLIETGIPFTEIYNEVMHKHSFEASTALALALGASKQAFDGKLVYTCLTREMLTQAGADSAEMDNVVEYLMSTKDAEASLFLYERHQSKKTEETPQDPAPPKEGERKIKVSMRSKNLDIGKIAAELGGGGHRMAAGCTLVGTMEGVLEQVLEIFAEVLHTCHTQ